MTSDMIQRITGVSTSISALNESKLKLEYAYQKVAYKGIAPNADGTLPDAVTVTDGLIDGTDIAPEEYALGMAAIGAIVTVLETEIAPGVTVEAALIALSR